MSNGTIEGNQRQTDPKVVDLINEIQRGMVPGVTEAFLDKIEAATGKRDLDLLPGVMLEYAKSKIQPEEHEELTRIQQQDPERFENMVATMVWHDSTQVRNS